MAARHYEPDVAQLVDEEFMRKLKEQIPNLREVYNRKDCDFILNYHHIDPNAKLDPATVLQNQPDSTDKKPSLIVKVHHTPDSKSTAPETRSSYEEKNLIVELFYKDRGKVTHGKNEEMQQSINWISQVKDLKSSETQKLKFLRVVSGNTLNSDEDFIKKLKEQVPDLKEVSTVEECDFILFFCPIVSQAETDIEAALQKLQRLSDTKPAFVVVLHHTFDPDSVVPDSRRIIKRERTLSVDCLFHEDEGLLQCSRNDEALYNTSKWINPQEKPQAVPQKNNTEPKTMTKEQSTFHKLFCCLSPSLNTSKAEDTEPQAKTQETPWRLNSTNQGPQETVIPQPAAMELSEQIVKTNSDSDENKTVSSEMKAEENAGNGLVQTLC
ncbi:uncharacterized protein [Hoplias malabaricus]|uniref:uncharacterized protein n=1 Tax=Hoplias malabaricus TaxID=27720 RepID=UPI0034637D6B